MTYPLMQTDSLESFTLVRYEPTSIILLQKTTRKPYQYFITENPSYASNIPIHHNISHPFLLRPILWRNGMLYAQGCENLASLVQSRRRDYHMERFSAVEVANTYEPILECLGYLHSQGVIYSKITAQHIVFFENGDIFLRDWLFNPDLTNSTAADKCTEKNLFQGSIKQNMKELGLLMVETATLIPLEELILLSTEEVASMLLEFYEIEFVIGVVILIEGLVKQFDGVLDWILGKNNRNIAIGELKQIIGAGMEIKNMRLKEKEKITQQNSIKIKLLQSVENEKPKIETPTKLEHKQLQSNNHSQNTNQVDSFQSSPTKKFNITTPNRKIIRLEDSENKKMLNEEVKKRQIEKITKIIERSNAFVNELMARKNGDKKYLGNVKVNASVYDTQENSGRKVGIVKNSPKIGSPTKRLRSISKKK